MKYNFPVEIQPIFTVSPKDNGMDSIDGRKAVVRQDTGHVLGIVSNKYELLKHADVVKGFRKALKDEVYVETIKLAQKGARLYATYSLPNHRFEVKPGDVVSLQFIVRNSYDGTNALNIMLGAFRLVCTNGMVIGKKFFTFSQKHIGAEAGGLDTAKLRDKVSMIAEQFTKTLPVMAHMSTTSVQDPFEYFDHRKVQIPKYLLDSAWQSYKADPDTSLWSVYNSLTWAITHGMKRYNPSMAIRYGQVAWQMTTEGI